MTYIKTNVNTTNPIILAYRVYTDEFIFFNWHNQDMKNKARLVTIIRGVSKESVQSTNNFGEVVPRPGYGQGIDLIREWNSSVGRSPYHASCINIKTSCSVGEGINVIEGNEDEVISRLDVVNSDGESFDEVIKKVCLDYISNGNGYIEVVSARNGSVSEIYWMPAVEIWKKPKGSNAAFLYRPESGVQMDIPAWSPEARGSSIISIKNASNLSKGYGYPSWYGIDADIDLDWCATVYNKKFFENSGVPDFILALEGCDMNDDEIEKMKESLSMGLKGLDNSHKTFVLRLPEGKAIVHKLGLEKNEGSMKALRESCRDRILAGHGVPPRMVGIVSSGIGGASDGISQTKLFQSLSIYPIQNAISKKVNTLLPYFLGSKAKIQFETIDTDQFEETVALHSNGIINTEEARAIHGYSSDYEVDTPAEEIAG